LIDWSRPWLAPYLDFRPLVEDADPLAALTQAAERLAVRTVEGLPVRFVPERDVGADNYEAHIARTGRVPTRDSRHDLFNALAWLAFPRVKAKLNALHVRHPSARPASGRGPERDAATLLDENGMLLACVDAQLADDVAAMRWSALFVEDRTRFGESACALLLGHALVDKLVNPFKAICAHAWVVVVGPVLPGLDPAQRRGVLDHAFAERLDADLISPRALRPLPVLGIPGWWPTNADPVFYNDDRVFRHGRRTRPEAVDPLLPSF
jgi:hypothetical protein